MDPSKQSELSSQLCPLQIRDEGDESNDVETEGDESMMLGEGERRREERRLESEDVFEVINERFSVEEVIRRREEVPARREQSETCSYRVVGRGAHQLILRPHLSRSAFRPRLLSSLSSSRFVAIDTSPSTGALEYPASNNPLNSEKTTACEQKTRTIT